MKHQTLSIKHYFIFILSVFAFQSAFAQQYTFEDEVPTDFTVSGGSLSITPDHYKDGTHSLRWEAEGVSVFTIKGFTSFKTTSSDATVFQLYLPAITNDTLTMECLLADGTVKRTATILCNYRGWREINRLYKEYSSTSAFQMAQLRFTLHPASAGKRYLCFDAMNLNAATDANRVPGCMWVLDYSYLKTNNTPLTFYRNRPNIPITTPTAQELADLEIVRSRVRPEMSYNAMQAIVAKNWVKNNIQLVRNQDGTIHGTIIDNSGTALKAATLKSTMERLQYLAGGKIKGENQEIVDAFDTYLEVLMDQGLADGCNITYASNSYGDPRAIIPIMLNVLIACDSAQAEEWVKVGKWVSQYYCMYYSDENFAYNQNSDIVYVFTLYHQVLAAFHPNKAEAVRELKAMKRFVDRMSTYVEGPKELLKPDGCGFHHNVFYLGYMYSYNTFTTALSNLRGTCFQIGEEGYRRFSKALITEYRILTPSTTDARHYALTLAGRHPFGTTSSYNNSLWKLLIDAGADYPQAQQELQSAYNYFYQNKQYDAPEVSYEGYVECNWSPIGVMRHKNWVAVMHAPTTKFWGSEIYTATNGGNRLGRYQGHGALNICYSGTNMLASGYPTNSTGGGWDWNVNPGTTTVHYTNWTEMLPNKNTTQRFDQYTNSTNFSGACGLDQCGVWASNFDQFDKFSSTVCFEATNLMFHKSVFCFDSLFVALGTDISSIGNYANDRITATNLDQAVVGNGLLKKKFYVDGEERELGYADTLDLSLIHI